MDIDDRGFELGMPSRVEMLEHQHDMLSNENDQLRRDLARARRNITKLVEINQGLSESLADTQKRVNDLYVEYVQERNRRYGQSFKTWGIISASSGDAAPGDRST